MKKSDLLNNDTDFIIEDSENKSRLTIGSIIMAIVFLVVLGIHYCAVIAENKALRSQNDSLKSSVKSLEANLLMPQVIKSELK